MNLTLLLPAKPDDRWVYARQIGVRHAVTKLLPAVSGIDQPWTIDAVPGMRSEQWGRILTIGSVQEIRPHPDMVVYAASKAGQTSMVRNLAKQLAPDGITVNNLAPGVISTDRNNERLADEAYAARVLGAIPAGRFGDVSDCIGAAVMLCSDLAGYITGQNLFVDGGMGL